jgi:hypothetical protein
LEDDELLELLLLLMKVRIFIFMAVLGVVLVIELLLEIADDEAQHVGNLTLEKLLIGQIAGTNLLIMLNCKLVIGLLYLFDMAIDQLFYGVDLRSIDLFFALVEKFLLL